MTGSSPISIQVYKASIVHSLSLNQLEFIEHGAIGVNENGRIVFVQNLAANPELNIANSAHIVDLGSKIIIPGFIDGHFHAPQYSFIGTGMDVPLLEWLAKYTFPHEAKFQDAEYAQKNYDIVVRRLIENGTTTCSYFATLHLEASKRLVDIVQKHGQRAIVGKVNMDRNSPLYLCETTEQSISDTTDFVNHVLNKQDSLVHPVITPRFAVNTTGKLLTALGKISREYDPKVRIQTHMSENTKEIEMVAEMFPKSSNYAQIYDRHGLLHERTYIAHCIWCSRGERGLLHTRRTGIIHCPNSNFSISSGVLNVRRLLNEGVKVGLGTDVSGGYSPSILDAIRQAITASKMVSIGLGSDADKSSSSTGERNIPESFEELSFAEAFFLATLGGAECLDLADTVGNFTVGKDFDALVVNSQSEGSRIDVFEGDTISEIFQRFLFLGDDRNIEEVYVKGKEIKSALKK
ncbi:hypothetical protein HK100_001566 [Physocladia obscura]|uniref:Guanine deaminase n=1 Tax=Physocladia obscura TaxID=109957 RepID=A0AAD5SZ79_9FUNG|nr:hypothetical protein HK100_001566 [Physocladia obscura]